MEHLNNHRVLVVDDDPAILHVCRECLASQTMTVVVARNVAEARQILAENHFDLLITDYTMPRQTGIDLVLGIRKEGNLIPVILMSGMPAVCEALKRTGIIQGEFLDKPFHPERLQNLVRRLICREPCRCQLSKKGAEL